MSLRGHLSSGLGPGDRLPLSVLSSSEIDSHIQCLQEGNKHDEEKLRSIQEIWDKFEVYSMNSNYYHPLERFVKATLGVLNDTAPHFIIENPVQKLRFRSLELLLRMSNHEAIKNSVKEVSKVMLRLIQLDNEKNASLAMKILNEIWRSNKIYFMPEISAATNFLKTLVKDMGHHVNNGMFDYREWGRNAQILSQIDDNIIESYLDHCWHIQPISVMRPSENRSGIENERSRQSEANFLNSPTKLELQALQYTIIPRSGMSLKLIQELSNFFVYIYQHHKQTMNNDCMDFLVICLEFICLQLPANYKEFTGVLKETMDDFHLAQCKMLTHITIMGKIVAFQEVLVKNANNVINAVLTLLETLDDKSVSTRKEVMIALKFIFCSEMKSSVIRFLPRLLDEDSILGKGFTARDNLRTFMYQSLADLLHHIRFQMSFPLLLQASSIFCRQMNDPTISFQTQVMCVRLLCSICEALPKMEQQGEATRDILWQILDNLAYKLERLAVYHLPLLVKYYGLEDANGRRIVHHEMLRESKRESKRREDQLREVEPLIPKAQPERTDSPEEEKQQSSTSSEPPLPPVEKSSRHTQPDVMLTNLNSSRNAINSPSMTVPEARNYVKYLLQTVRNCCTNIQTSARSNLSYPVEKERDIMECLLKYGLVCMDVFLLICPGPKQMVQGQRCKEEKEALDGFANIFIAMDAHVYKEVFAKHIKLIIDRIHINPTVQLFANAFLVRSDFVCKFGGIMIRYLMANMDKLAGSLSTEKTTLYVKLFKIIFSAIGCGNAGLNPRDPTTEGELMLKPYLSDLIRKATEYALTAKEPLNYFLLLRALFRSIGGGAHDILYGQFLPLLPNLLHFLNKLQSCNARLQMRELFLELCLTVPVRLSSLLPYLPLLMDPLVCALNGTTSLVQQGLRTLELCVDNLQPEYLFEHMAPVRSALIQGLWKVLSTAVDQQASTVAFRILGKFGGANRRVLNCPQNLNWIQKGEGDQTVFILEFPRSHPEMPIISGELTITEVIAFCMEQMGHLCYRIPRVLAYQPDSTGNLVSLLPYSMTTSAAQIAQNQLIKESCMELARSVLICLFSPTNKTNIPDYKNNITENFKEYVKRIDTAPTSPVLFKGVNEHDRKVVIQALNIIMMGVIQKELRPKFLYFYTLLVRQLALQGLMESVTPLEMLIGPKNLFGARSPDSPLCVDSAILVDAIAVILTDISKDFLSSAVFALAQINDVAAMCISDKERYKDYPFLRYTIETVTNLCYGPSWCYKLGGANGLCYIIKHMPKVFLAHYHRSLTDALIEVIVGLSDEISSGACEMALQSIQALHDRLLKGYDMIQDPKGYLRTKFEVYLPKLFATTLAPRSTIWELIMSLEKESGETYPIIDIMVKHVDIIRKEKLTIIQNLSRMTMMEQECSLSALNILLDNVPQLVELDFNDGTLEPFFETIFDICETEAPSLLQRDSYKAMENCTAHFLPPSPIVDQMEGLRSIAVNTLIYSYKTLCLGNLNPDENERKTSFASRVLTIAVKCALHGEKNMQNIVAETLRKCKPVPLEYLTGEANQIINNFNDGNGDVESVVRMEKLISFNHELWSKELADKFVDQIQSWQTTSLEDGFPSRCRDNILGIQAVMQLILRGQILDFNMVMKLVNFIAFFELHYTTDTDFGWIPSLCELISYFPLDMVKVFCSKDFLGCHTTFLCKILEQDGAKLLRKVLKDDAAYLDNLLLLKTLEKGSWERYIAKDLETLNVYEESIMRVVDTVIEKEPEWFESNHHLIDQMKRVWTTPEFKDRYSIAPVYIEEDNRKLVRVQTFPASKMNVPHLFGKCFIQYLRKNHDALDILFELMLAFDGCFATDFGFIRDFLEHEIIPLRSIPWRVRCFETILDRLQDQEDVFLKSSLIARMIQYVIHPCFQFVFERYPSADVLGPGLPADEETIPDPNHCMARLTALIEKHKHGFSEQNTIAMYQLCTLLVEYAPNHIHNNECKKQGTRLRVFMVFVWTTLTSSTANYMIDPTVRFTGYFFLAHLIDKFNISRKIVLQVFNTLLMQYQLDNRDLVRRAIDVVTPAVPVRLQDDGNQQLLVHVKRILTEEAQNIAHVAHVVFSITRNYKVYYNVRHEIIPTLINIAIRVMQAHNYGTSEGHTIRRMSLDICEMAVKWELLRHHRERSMGDPDYIGIESMLEVLKTNDRDEKEEADKRDRVTTISKEHVDTIINLLLKFACTLQHQVQTANTSQQFAQQAADMGRRALGLLRAALKPGIWGDITGIKYPWLEKQLTIPTEYTRNDGQHHAYGQHLVTAQQTMETLLQLSNSMSRTLLLSVLKPLQRALITCMMQTSQGVCNVVDEKYRKQAHQLIKSINYLLQKLFEKSKMAGISNGLDELETLNQYIVKYLNDHFTNYYKTPNSAISLIFSAFSVLRSICAHYPSYLDNTCLVTFLKVMEKVVRDHMHTHNLHQDPAREKSEDVARRERVLSAMIDFISVGLELLRLRVAHISAEHRKTLCQNILLPLIEKCIYDKVIEVLIKITHEILITHTDKNAANPGLPLALRLHVQCERRFLKHSKDLNHHPLMPNYLAMVLVIFENPTFKASEAGVKISNAFYWGLMSPDPITRSKFLKCWEKSHEPFVVSRIMAILKDESWHHFRKYNWLRHAIWLLLQSSVAKPYGEFSSNRPIYYGSGCTSWFRTIEQIIVPTVPALGATSMDCTAASSFSSPGQTQDSQNPPLIYASDPLELFPNPTEAFPHLPPKERLIEGQIKFLKDVIHYNPDNLLANIYSLMFNTSDQKFMSKIFVRLFVSIWKKLLPAEKQDIQKAIVPFLTSGAHSSHINNPQQQSVLIPWLEAVDQTLEIKLPADLLYFISKSHLGWHKGLLILERETRFMENNYLSVDINVRRGFMNQAYGENEHTPYKEALDHLANLYKDMEEMDMYAAIWDKRAIKQETVNIFNHIQRGETKEAFKAIDNCICETGDLLSTPGHGALITPPLEQELNVLYNEYAVCCQELLEWEKLRDYANHPTSENPVLLMKAAMHLPDWMMVRDCLDQLMGCIPQKLLSTYHVYQMMSQIIMRRDHPELILNQPVQNISQFKSKIEKFMEESVNHHITMWRGLPNVVSNAHVKILQASSIIREVADCVDLRIALDANSTQNFSNDFMNQLKHITKVWRNRLCATQDELSFQALIYGWRTQIHHMAMRRLEEWDQSGVLLPLGTNSSLILPVHSSAQGQLYIAKAAKSMKLFDLSIDLLNKLHTLSAVPALDAHNKICNHLKILRLQAERTSDPKQRQDFYQLGLHLINETSITYFAPDQVSKIFTLRGQFLSCLDKREEAVKVFSLATQIILEKAPSTLTSAYKCWGDHQDRVLQNDQTELSAMTAGAGGLSCFFEVARGIDNDNRAKKYIGKLLWTSKQMIASGDIATIRVDDIIEKNERTTIPYNWLCWLPQLINDIRQRPNSNFTKILSRICEDFPLQIFYNLRCVFPAYVTDALIEEFCQKSQQLQTEHLESWIQALIPIMRQAITMRPPDCRIFNTFLNELNTMKEFWVERQYRFALNARNEITRAIHAQNQQGKGANDLYLDQDCITAIQYWRDDFDRIGEMVFLRENELNYISTEAKPDIDEEIFIHNTTETIRSFFAGCPCLPGQVIRYLDLLANLIKSLYLRIQMLPKNLTLKLASPWLAEFTNRMGCIELPRDLFNVQKTVGSNGRITFPSPFSSKDQQYTASQYCSMIARVDPFYSVSIEGGEVVKKLGFKSTNGKCCLYYLRKTVKQKLGVENCNKFLEHMNYLLTKERETARRYLATPTMIQLQVAYGCTLLETATNMPGDSNPEAKFPYWHPMEIFAQKILPITMHPDNSIVFFYERIFAPEVTKESEVFAKYGQLIEFGNHDFVGQTNLLEHFMTCYPDATHFYSFRKQIARHMAVFNILDFLLNLTPPKLQDIYITRNYGQYIVPNYAFQLPHNCEQRAVPFRLTINFQILLGYSIEGDFRWAAESTISCLRYRKPEIFLRPLLYDFITEMLPGTYKDHVSLVNRMIYDFQCRVKNYDAPELPPGAMRMDGIENLIRAATSSERISLMDPSLYPWF